MREYEITANAKGHKRAVDSLNRVKTANETAMKAALDSVDSVMKLVKDSGGRVVGKPKKYIFPNKSVLRVDVTSPLDSDIFKRQMRRGVNRVVVDVTRKAMREIKGIYRGI